MKILIVSAEVVPFSKTGGLADVAGSLPYALKSVSDCEVKVISPYYRCVKKGGFSIKKVRTVDGRKALGDIPKFELLKTDLGGIEFYFIGRDEYYDRDNLYGTPQGDYDDNALRFSFFCRSALLAAEEISFYPDIIHTNDWETALVPLYRDMISNEQKIFKRSKVLYSIHNLAYQGSFSFDKVKDIGLTSEQLKAITHQGAVNFMKAGILFSDRMVTVSKKYAQEILTPEYGFGMEDDLTMRKERLYGILNGVDYSQWNPETDTLIPETYDKNSLKKKTVCKRELMGLMGIDLPLDRPLIGSVGRLAEQKGVDIIIDSIDSILGLGCGFVLLGAGEKRYEDALMAIKRDRPKVVGVSIGFDERLAHMIEAGSDIFIIPSRYEPCGLNQMYSLKYGTVPLVRASGGLDDTVIDYTVDPANGNGFKFKNADSENFIGALGRAVDLYSDKVSWESLQKRGMALDFSWKKSAKEYAALYKKIMDRK